MIGGGGHAKVVIDAIRLEGKFNIRGIIDPKLPKGTRVEEIEVLGGDELLEGLYAAGMRHAFIGVGTIGNYETKITITQQLKMIGYTMPVVCHPSSTIASSADLVEGTFVAGGAVINSGVTIGKHAIINTRASIDHDCHIGDYTHIAPGAVLCGEVTVGEQVHIGAGAIVVQGVKIKDKAFVKAASRVAKDI